ncbi:hypothetical protein M2158_006242 [Streptomyces sp. SAI-144]|nr:hypothetical protein [Streptomyces sp. SAI-144]
MCGAARPVTGMGGATRLPGPLTPLRATASLQERHFVGSPAGGGSALGLGGSAFAGGSVGHRAGETSGSYQGHIGFRVWVRQLSVRGAGRPPAGGGVGLGPGARRAPVRGRVGSGCGCVSFPSGGRVGLRLVEVSVLGRGRVGLPPGAGRVPAVDVSAFRPGEGWPSAGGSFGLPPGARQLPAVDASAFRPGAGRSSAGGHVGLPSGAGRVPAVGASAFRPGARRPSAGGRAGLPSGALQPPAGMRRLRPGDAAGAGRAGHLSSGPGTSVEQTP